jgi:hypothetical protein
MTTLIHAGNTVSGLNQHRRQEPEGRARITHTGDAQDQRRIVGSGYVIGEPAARNVKELNSKIWATVHS